jgi:hypothetical protein
VGEAKPTRVSCSNLAIHLSDVSARIELLQPIVFDEHLPPDC